MTGKVRQHFKIGDVGNLNNVQVLKSGTMASASEGVTRQSFNVMSRGHAYYGHALEDLKLLDRFDMAFLTPVPTNIGRG